MKLKFQILIMLCLLFGAFGVLAQELPPDLTPIPDPSPVDGGRETVIDDVREVSPDVLRVNTIQVIIGLLSAFASGGVIGIAGVAIFIDRIRNDKATVTALENLANSFPPSTKEILEKAFVTTQKIGQLGAEVFDGVPINEKLVQLE